jgi:hypothetical protein
VLFLNYLFNKHSYLRTSNDNGGDLVYLDKDSHRKDFQFYEKYN